MVLDDGSIKESIEALQREDDEDDGEDHDARSRRMVKEYYNSGSSYGMPASSIMFALCQKLNKADKELLW